MTRLGHLSIVELVEVRHIIFGLDCGLVGCLHIVTLKPSPVEGAEPLVLDNGGSATIVIASNRAT